MEENFVGFFKAYFENQTWVSREEVVLVFSGVIFPYLAQPAWALQIPAFMLSQSNFHFIWSIS